MTPEERVSKVLTMPATRPVPEMPARMSNIESLVADIVIQISRIKKVINGGKL